MTCTPTAEVDAADAAAISAVLVGETQTNAWVWPIWASDDEQYHIIYVYILRWL